MKLNYKVLGEGSPVVILHGLFGMLDNWITFGRALSANYKVFLVDQRNHGNSPHSEAHSYTLMAEDLLAFCEEHQLQKITLIGHSMGAKTAMRFALDNPERVANLIVIDMGVQQYTGGHETIFRALRTLDLESVTSRKEAEFALTELIPEPGVRQFLLKNLHRTEDNTYAWKFNLEALYQHYAETLSGITAFEPYLGKVTCIRGGNSGYVQDADWDAFTTIFPNAQLFTIPDAGHWVHADQPDALLQLVERIIA